MTKPTTRRPLKFSNLNEMLTDVHRLQAQGYRAVGKWDLAQVCNHLADWMTYPVTGFPKPNLPIRILLWVLKQTMGKRILTQILAEGSMRAGGQTMPETIHPPGQDVSAAVQRLEQAVERFQKHPGDYHPSPIFGAMDRETCTQLQQVHCAHHLNFLIPQ